MDKLAANLSQNLDLVEDDSPKNWKACFKGKKGNTHTPTGSEVMLK